MNRTTDHLTVGTQPAAIALLTAIAETPDDAEHLGIRHGIEGAVVDWDRLINSGRLTPPEAAVAIIASGIAVLETTGSRAPRHLRAPLRDAIGKTLR